MEEIILKFIIKIKTGSDEFFVSKDDLYNKQIYNYDMNKAYEFNSYIEARNWDEFDTIKPECISIVKKIRTIETKYEECINQVFKKTYFNNKRIGDFKCQD